MCRLRNIALESVTEKCDRRTDRRRTMRIKNDLEFQDRKISVEGDML